MIKSLRIKNLATIEDLEIHFHPGFSILTGETGVGKSIIIGGVMLILGEKGSPDMIRTGETETSVEAVFRFSTRDADLLETYPSDSREELFLQRRISDQTATKGYINGTLVTMKTLKDIGRKLVDIYGQNDHVFLRQVENQRDYLDEFAGAEKLREETARSAKALRDLIAEKAALVSQEKERSRRLDFLGFQIDEIEKAQLTPDEEIRLRQERHILRNAEMIAGHIQEALNIAYEQESSLLSGLTRMQRILDDLSGYDKIFHEYGRTAGESAIFIRELSDYLIGFQDRDLSASGNLEQVESRLSQIEHLKRKYGDTIEDVLAFLDKIRQEHQDLSGSRDKLERVSRELETRFAHYSEKARELSALRRKVAESLERKLEAEIAQLGMNKAKIHIHIESRVPSVDNADHLKDSGIDDVEVLISPNPGETPKPLRRIASGGELSRIMLALKSISQSVDTASALIFDEIDSGIGGKTAEFVARKLSALAADHQVICITHLPQIASFASHHYKIEKSVSRNRTFTTVKELDFEERVAEIARLSAGSRITPSALQNAREMLEHNLNFSKRPSSTTS